MLRYRIEFAITTPLGARLRFVPLTIAAVSTKPAVFTKARAMADLRTAVHLVPAALAAVALIVASLHTFGGGAQKHEDSANASAALALNALRSPLEECESYAREHQACLEKLSTQRRKGSEEVFNLRTKQFEAIRSTISTPQAREGLAAACQNAKALARSVDCVEQLANSAIAAGDGPQPATLPGAALPKAPRALPSEPRAPATASSRHLPP